MIINMKISDSDIESNELYTTELPARRARVLLDDSIILLNSAYDLRMDSLDETELSEDTKNLLTENKLIQLSNLRDDGWVTDTAIAMINFVYGEKLFSLLPLEQMMNYSYEE